MNFSLSLLGGALQKQQSVQEVMHCNAVTCHYGLSLTEAQAVALIDTRSLVLRELGRIEFGGGLLEKLIVTFCDSPNLSMHDYEECLHELLEVFYYYKNETLDQISDDDLLEFMKQSFDGVCQGSLDLLSGRELERLARRLRGAYHEEDDNESD